MNSILRNASASLVSLGLALTAVGCMPDQSHDIDPILNRANASAAGFGSGQGGRASAGTGRGAAGVGATGAAGSSAIGVAGLGGVSTAGFSAGGVSGMQGIADAGAAGNTVPTAGSGGPSNPIAGSRASGNTGGMSGNAGARAAAGNGGRGAVTAGAGGSPTSTGGIWMPKPGVTWQWQLTGTLDTSVDAQMYDIDLFSTPAATIQTLHSAGRIVICYFSAGSYEPGRPDSDALSKTGLGSVLDGWPDEKWLDVRSTAVRDLMKARLDTAKSKGCDGVEPDNVDGFDNDNGLGLTRQDALDYDRFLATESHARGLSIGLKNSLVLASSLVSSFDWALNEECLQYDECEDLEPFIAAGKAVFHCEYGKSTNGICDSAPQGFSTIVKNLDLDAFRVACE